MEGFKQNEERVKLLSSFMQELLDNNSPLSKRDIYNKYENIISEIKPIDLFYLEMYKEDTELSIDEIKESAGKFVNVFHNALSEQLKESYDSDLFSYFIKENREIEKRLDMLKPYFKKDNIENNVQEILKRFEELIVLDTKFVKRELVLWPNIEEILPSTTPLKVLWSLHDDARVLLKEILQTLRKESLDIMSLVYMIGEYYYLIYGINQREEIILFPIADGLLTIEDKNQLYDETIEFGYCFIDNIPKANKVEKEDNLLEGFLKSKTGSLSMKEVDVIFGYLPLDITFVDKNDKVQYFNNRPERHFPRNPSIIGRLVKYCHPPKSVEVVERIINAFKESKKDSAEFWIDFRGTFLYITYYAVRDKLNKYMGTLEVSQDVTKIRNLEGERRLLEWKD